MWTWLCDIYEWLKVWQTLVGAILALIAALWTIAVMNRQSRAVTARLHKAEERKKIAARAQMPDALGDMAAYAKACADRLNGTTTTAPDLPTVAVGILKTVIEFVDDDAAARTFELVSWYQVQRARLIEGFPSHPHHEYDDRLYDTVLLMAYVSSLFDYARNRSEKVSMSTPSREEMTAALKNAVGLAHYATHETHYAEVYKTIERRHDP